MTNSNNMQTFHTSFYKIQIYIFDPDLVRRMQSMPKIERGAKKFRLASLATSYPSDQNYETAYDFKSRYCNLGLVEETCF